MNAETLTFIKNGDWYESDFVSPGVSVPVQIEQEKPSDVCVFASLPGLKPVSIGVIVNHHLHDLIFEVEAAEGININLRTLSPIVDAKILME